MSRADLHRIADLLGLPRITVRGVERRADGSYSVLIRSPQPGSGPALAMPRWALNRRVVRFPRRRVEGYRPCGPVRPRDARARRRANEFRFAFWLLGRIGPDAPVVRRALSGGDLSAIAELRTALVAAASPEDEPGRVGVVIFVGTNGDGGRAAA